MFNIQKGEMGEVMCALGILDRGDKSVGYSRYLYIRKHAMRIATQIESENILSPMAARC